MQPGVELLRAETLRNRLSDDNRAGNLANRWRLPGTRIAIASLLLTAHFVSSRAAWPERPESALPDAPNPQNTAPASKAAASPCQVRNAGASMGALAARIAAAAAEFPTPVTGAGPQRDRDEAPCSSSAALVRNLPLIKNMALINWYARSLDGPQVKPMTPKEKAWLAMRNVADPFNGITILGSSAIAVGSDAHSEYGPGMRGFGRYAGVSLTQDMTGEFFGTFLIPSIVRQDPHYHRVPNASMKKRIAHALHQVVWTQGDDGQGMMNYANLVGFAIDDEIGNLYVPGRKTDLGSSVARYATGLATAPIDNFVSEFLPDVARHIHVQIVVIQRIINQVANKEGGGTT